MSVMPPDPPEEDGDAERLGSNVILLPGLASAGGPPEERFPQEPAEGLEDGRPPGELGPPEPHLLEGALEALMLAADGPVREHELERWLGHPGMEAVREGLYGIQDRLRRGYGGIRLVQVAKGWQLRTDVRFSPWVSAMRDGRPVKLSRAALETMSIVAYRQPVTRGEVENLRGVDSGGVLRMLCERGLVAVTGRADSPGRPLIYNTTQEFLAMFSLRDLSDLPTLRDLRELRRDDPREGPGGTSDDEDLALEPTEPTSAGDLPHAFVMATEQVFEDEWANEAPAGAPTPAQAARGPRQTSLLPPDPDDFADPEDEDGLDSEA